MNAQKKHIILHTYVLFHCVVAVLFFYSSYISPLFANVNNINTWLLFCLTFIINKSKKVGKKLNKDEIWKIASQPAWY